MILTELNNLILTTVLSNTLVNDGFVGDVYDVNSKENKYGCFVATPQTAVRVERGVMQYRYALYYIDRLTEDERNLDAVQADAVSVLKQLLGYLEDCGYIQIEEQYQFTLFRHQFDDWCAGAYVEVSMLVKDNECGYDFLPSSGDIDLTSLTATSNGSYSASTGTAWNWVNVNVQPSMTSIDGYILTPAEYRKIFTPSGGFDGYSYVDISVSYAEGMSKLYTSNGNFTISSTAFLKTVDVTVAVPTANIQGVTITSNGLYKPEDYNVDGWGPINVTVPQNVNGYTVDDIAARNIRGSITGSSTIICGNAFYFTSVKSAYFENCSEIYAGAFDRCSLLTTVSFPACRIIDAYAFRSCISLTTVSFPACTFIGGSAFRYCNNLTTVSFPVCSYIGAYAFADYNSLTTASFPACLFIGEGAFSGCRSLTTASFPACSYISSYAFDRCSVLTTVSFPSCISVGFGAFERCPVLTTASFPVCTTVSNFAFSGCSSLTTASFPVCTSVGNYAFDCCSSLTTVSLPSAKYIGYCCFRSCSALTTLSLPYVSCISGSAFRFCNNLESLYIGENKPYVCELASRDVFYETPMSASSYIGHFGSIFVPASLVDAYKSATNWVAYSNRITAIPT